MNIRDFFSSKTGKCPKFLGTDEESRDIFYPWGYPGESFFITKKQKKLLSTFEIKALAVIFLFSFGASELFNPKEAVFLYIAFIATVPIFYGAFVYCFTKGLEPNAFEKRTIGKPLVINNLFAGVGFYVLNLAAAIYFFPLVPLISGLLAGVSLIFTAILVFLIIFLKKTNGYILQKMRGYES